MILYNSRYFSLLGATSRIYHLLCYQDLHHTNESQELVDRTITVLEKSDPSQKLRCLFSSWRPRDACPCLQIFSSMSCEAACVFRFLWPIGGLSHSWLLKDSLYKGCGLERGKISTLRKPEQLYARCMSLQTDKSP